MNSNLKFIAVIEDDESVRRALERQIRAAGYRCEGFPTAESFVAVAHGYRTACVVCDIHLPGMSGLQLALHPLLSALNLPVIFITGSSEPLIEIPAREIGAAFLRKPIPGQELLDALLHAAGPPDADP